MKGGIVYSNFVTTASPQHAWEVTYTDQGVGLAHTLHLHHERNGFVFHQVDHMALESALARALGLWHSHPEQFRDLALNGMRANHSWAPAGQDYLNIYDRRFRNQ